MGLCCVWPSALLLSLLVLTATQGHETGTLGDAVTLKCSYDTKINGLLDICWGRGTCPISRCNNLIIKTVRLKVTSSRLDKYQLLGDIANGDVSLTINDLDEEDKGIYCCRVAFSGLFNDQKTNIDLRVEDIADCPEDSDEATTAEVQGNM
ncbi:hepatitis A virus cellular receptor 1 homolog [Hyperolius riggenbachi]|uniref:hepatitis A virus cellular receptor 1 homolog n=1 Tax=Hyperolius riggenbachi TaxID=752182 RepID=UPI0035A3AEEE